MNKGSSLIIVGSIGIAIIIVFGIYTNQDYKINEVIKEPEKYDTGDQTIDEKLNEIAKAANGNDFKPAPREWQTSGPFQIDRTQYLLGEKIFLRIGGLDTNEKGQIAFLKQSNETHYTVYQTIPFDASTKIAFNYYTDIKLSKALGLCSMEDVIGEWTVVFRGTEYQNLKFEISDQILPGEESNFNSPVC